MLTLDYHPRNPQEARFRLLILALLATFGVTWALAHARGDEPSRYGRPEACTVIIGGCSGVSVSSEGHILTAGHCDCKAEETVKWKDGREVKAHKVFDTGKAEGVEVYDCEGDGFPYLAVSPRPPKLGDKVWSYGYPVRSEVQQLEYGSGILGRSERFEYKGDAVYANVTSDVGAFPGWSGGPLLNDRQEVIGLCHGFSQVVFPILPIPVSPKENIWIGWSHVREACEAAIAPPNILTVYIWDKGCIHCERFKKDCDSVDMTTLSGVFAGQPVQFRYTAGSAPRFALNGKTKNGYAGKADLLTWMAAAGAKPKPEPKPEPKYEPIPDAVPAPVGQPVPRRPDAERKMGWQRMEEQKRRTPIPEPTPETHEIVDDAPYGTPAPDTVVEDSPDWTGVRLIAAFRLDTDSFISLRKRGAEYAEDLLQKVTDDRGLPVRIKVVSRDFNAEGFDRLDSAVGGVLDGKVTLVALVPVDTERSGLVKSIIIRKLEAVAESYLDGTPLKVVFERSDPAGYEAAVNATLAYASQSSESPPFEFGHAGLVAIITRRCRIAEMVKNLIDRFRGKA